VDSSGLIKTLEVEGRHLRCHQRVFGLARGAALEAVGRLHRGRHVEVHVGNDPRPLWLRLGTTDVAVFDEVVIRGEYDFAAPRSASTIVDVGANIGVTSAWYAARYPGCRVLAVEPEPANFATLQRNVANRPEVTPVRGALCGSSGLVALVDAGTGAWGFQLAAVNGSAQTDQTVRAVTLTELFDEHNLDWVDLLKIDIEGAERDVFMGDLAALDRVGAIAVELHDRFRPGCSRSFFRAVADFPYEEWRGLTVVVAREEPSGARL